ncbi:Fibronectin type III [Acidimicrobiia bacterium]
MFEAITRRARRIAAITAAGALVATGFALPVVNATAASADTLEATVATATAVAATPAFTGQTTNGLVDGQTVAIRVDRVGTNNISAIEVRLCRSGANVSFDSDFNPSQGGRCINAPLSASSDATVSADGQVGASPTFATVNFRVGTGTNSFTRQNGQTATITCNATSPCDLVIKVMTPANANQYKSFAVTYAGTPGAPTAVGVVAGSTQADVSWTAPTNTGNAPISSYTVTATPETGTPVVKSGVTGTSTTVTGLSNFTSYSFTVVANTIGSFVSAGSTGAVASPAPAGPTALGGVPAGGAISLSWTAPSAAGVTNYQVSYTPSGGSVATVLTGSTGVTYTLSGLTNGTSYTVTVAAVYSGGTTTESNAVAVTPTAAVQGESFTVVVPNGSLTLTSAASGAINLGTAVLDTTARFWESTGTLSALTVRDTRYSATEWSLSISSSTFIAGSNSFSGANLGITPLRTSYTTDTPATPGAVVLPRNGVNTTPIVTTGGLSSGRTFSSSAASGNLGETVMGGTLKLSVPTSQAPGTYTGTLTITAL